MVVVKVAETYDLHTARNEVGVIGIHTPSTAMLAKMWPGFFQNYKYVKIRAGNIRCACASYLPADPLQVGVTIGKVAPQDMFNPILYKAVSNDSFETVVASIYQTGSSDDLSGGSLDRHYVFPGDASDPDNPYDQWDLYYGFLAQPGWKKSMPQAGFSMNGLKPLVHEVLNTFGNVRITGTSVEDTLNTVYGTTDAGAPATKSGLARTFRGRTMPMPRLPTYVSQGDAAGSVASRRNEIPVTWCACIIVPPSKLNTLYYRMRVEWYIEFSGPRSAQSIGLFDAQAILGSATYYSSYADTSKNMDKTTDSVDTIGLDVEKVMES